MTFETVEMAIYFILFSKAKYNLMINITADLPLTPKYCFLSENN